MSQRTGNGPHHRRRGGTAPGCFRSEIVIIKFLTQTNTFPRLLPLAICRHEELFSARNSQQRWIPTPDLTVPGSVKVIHHVWSFAEGEVAPHSLLGSVQRGPR